MTEPNEQQGPRIGRDEWVARHGDNRDRRAGIAGAIEERLRRVPWWAWLALFTGIVCLLPIGVESGYARRIAFDTVIYMLLALGLNVVVGWGGLLDLGYVAFFGVGAYTYAFLSSDKFDVHLPAILTIPVACAVGGAIGLLVGLPSRRLVGDYLAIVTLFFFQIFLTLTNNTKRSEQTGGRLIPPSTLPDARPWRASFVTSSRRSPPSWSRSAPLIPARTGASLAARGLRRELMECPSLAGAGGRLWGGGRCAHGALTARTGVSRRASSPL